MSFFFFKQKTAYEMRISDWSSDVCSSDLRSGKQSTRVFRARPEAASTSHTERSERTIAPGPSTSKRRTSSAIAQRLLRRRLAHADAHRAELRRRRLRLGSVGRVGAPGLRLKPGDLLARDLRFIGAKAHPRRLDRQQLLLGLQARQHPHIRPNHRRRRVVKPDARRTTKEAREAGDDLAPIGRPAAAPIAPATRSFDCSRSPVKTSTIAIFCAPRSEEHTSELQSLMRISYAVFCLEKK